MKRVVLALALPLLLEAQGISELFDALQKQPISKIDAMNSKMAKISQKKVTSSYYPKLNMFASYTHYNSPTNLRPLSPIEAAKLTSKNEPLPFSTTIQKVGLKLSMPIFMKELSSLSQKAKFLAKSAKTKKKINFYENEAIILGANASLQYLDNLLVAMHSTQNSLQKTKHDITISVNSGRMPGIELDKIDEKLNQLDTSINNVKIKRLNLISKIAELTNITIKHSLAMSLTQEINSDEIILLKPLRDSIDASLSDLQATKDARYYPKVFLNGMYSKNYAQDNVKDERDLDVGYGYYEVVLSMPLYDRGKSIDIELKKIALMKSKMKLEKTKQELQAQIKSLKDGIVLLKKSKKLNDENIQNQKNLLKYAKMSFDEGRMTQEDYLRYEDALLNAKSAYFEVVSQIWQNIGKLAVIYGVDLKEIVR